MSNTAFKRAIKLITDKEKNCPEVLEWGWLVEKGDGRISINQSSQVVVQILTYKRKRKSR